ncbi:carbohydrate ABC transporter permease [Lapidilactobacillus wuchangensis]|uniref:carbohydrate ABC transporter permease n=1 Tax=Lapidilactobacillus wuchangensis TaxID=2486001 RepID=UPI00177C08FA|nr:sugar ABC transporter permease [Lapidilactobacillus wuchangensis]
MNSSETIGRIPNRSKKRNQIKRTFGLLAPGVLLLLVFFITPMVLTVIFSFTNLSLTGDAAANLKFVGFQNFVTMFKDPELANSIWKTIIFVVFSAVIGQCFFGFLIALLMRGKNKTFRRVVGLIIIAAWVTPEVVVSFCWVAFLSDGGTLNKILVSLLNIKPIAWLYSFPMISVVIANIWRGTAFSMMVFQTALDDIPAEIEEAAVIDGASRWQITTRITIPMVRGTIATNIMLVTLQTLGVFTLIYTMTGGGPGNATSTLPVFMYKQAFVSYQLGYGTAISLVLLVIGAVASLLYMKVLKVKV